MSGGFYGADVAELRQLSQRFSVAADELDRASRLLSQTVATATRWQGRDADGFRSQWHGPHRSSIAAAVTGLRSAAQALGRNADEQERASAPGAAGGSVGQSWSSAGLQGLTGVLGGRPQVPVDIFAGLDAGEVVDRLQSLTLPTGQSVWDMAELVGNALGSNPLGVVSDLQHAGKLLESIAAGEVSLTEASHVVASALDHVPVAPVRLTGVAIDVWTDFAEEYSKADFSSDGLATVGNYILEDPLGAVEGALDGIAGYLPKAGSHLLSAFGIRAGV